MKSTFYFVLIVIVGLGFNLFTSAKTANHENLPKSVDNTIEKITDPTYQPGTIRHFVAFKFKPQTPAHKIADARQSFLNLKNECLRQGRPYIQSIEVGKANSQEGADQGKQLAFIVTFNSLGDRNYYVGVANGKELSAGYYDPAHKDFKVLVGPLLDTPVVPNGVFVFDFTVEEKK